MKDLEWCNHRIQEELAEMTERAKKAEAEWCKKIDAAGRGEG